MYKHNPHNNIEYAHDAKILVRLAHLNAKCQEVNVMVKLLAIGITYYASK